MSVALLDEDERTVLVALQRNRYCFDTVAASLDLDTSEHVSQIFQRVKAKLIGSPEQAPPESWKTSREIASLLGVGRNTCRLLCERYDELAVVARNPGNNAISKYYPPVVVELVKSFYSEIDGVKEWFCAWDIAKIIGASQHWVEKYLQGYHQSAVDMVSRAGRITPHYPRTVVDDLVFERARHPVQGEYLNILQVAKQSGVSYRKAGRILGELGIMPETRRAPCGKLAQCYHPGSVSIIRIDVDSLPSQDDWVGVTHIARQAGISLKFTKSILEHLGISGEPRYSESVHRPLVFFPPQTIQLVIEFVSRIPKADGWVNCEMIQRLTGRSHLWVRKRLADRSYPNEIRIGGNGRPQTHYPPWVQYTLKQESQNIAPS